MRAFASLILLLALFVQPVHAAPPTEPASAQKSGGMPAAGLSTTAAGSPTAGTASGAQPNTASSPYLPRIKPYTEDVGAVFSLLWTLCIALALLGAIWLLRKEWKRDPLIVEPFDVPKELQEMGLTGMVLSQRLVDHIFELQRTARPDDGPADIAFVELPRMQVDLQLPGISWSVRGAIRYFKQALGRSEKRLVGEVLNKRKIYSIHLRSSSGRAVEVPVMFRHTGDLNYALSAAAECAVSLVNTLEAATIFYSRESARSGYRKTLETIRLHLETAPAETHQEAYVLWASVCKAIGDFTGMESKLALARSAGAREWAGEQTGRLGTRYHNFKGSLHREKREFSEAQRHFNSALRVDKHNIGAMTNLGLLFHDMDRTADATHWFHKLIKDRPRSSRGYRGLGLMAMKKGDANGAVRYLTRAIDVAPYARWPRVNRIEALRIKGDLDDANADIQSFLSLDMEFAPLYRFWGRVLKDAGDLEAALEKTRRATEIDPHDPWGHIEVARVFLQMGQNENAIAMAKTALSKRKNSPDAIRVWSSALREQGNPAEAEAKFREAAAAQSTDIWSQLELSDLLRSQGRYAEAIAASQEALHRQAGSADALRRWAWALRDQGDLPGAKEKLNEAIRAQPADIWGLLELCDVLRTERLYDEAITAARHALTRQIKPSAALRRWARVLKDQGNLIDAEAKLNDAVATQPSDIWGRLELSDLLREQERYADAISAAKQALGRQPKSADAWRRLAWALRDLGDLAGAESNLKEAATAAPYDIYALIDLADVLRSGYRYPEAIAAAERARMRRPQKADPLRCLARVLIDQDDFDGAVSSYDRAIEVEPSALSAWLDLISLYRNQGRYDEAIAVAQRALNRHPRSVAVLLRFAWTLVYRGDRSGAEAKFEEANAVDTGEVWGLLDLSTYLRQESRHEDAIKAAQRALDRNPHSADAMRAWARALEAQGEISGAVSKLQEAAAASPSEIQDLLNIARLNQAAGDPQGASSTLVTALKRRPTSLRVLRNLADLLFEQGDVQAAEARLHELIDLAPAETQDLLTLAELLADSRPDSAIACMKLAHSRHPTSEEVLRRWADLLRKLNDKPAAVTKLMEAIAAAPSEIRSSLRLADWLRSEGRIKEAIVVLEEAHARRPKSASVMRELASLLRQDGDIQSANARLQDAIKATSPTKDTELLELADLMAQFGLLDDAIVTAKRATGLYPIRSYPLKRLSKLLHRKGDVPNAIAALEKATVLDSKDDWLWLELAELQFAAGQVDRAIHSVKKALEIRPNNEYAAELLSKIETQKNGAKH